MTVWPSGGARDPKRLAQRMGIVGRSRTLGSKVVVVATGESTNAFRHPVGDSARRIIAGGILSCVGTGAREVVEQRLCGCQTVNEGEGRDDIVDAIGAAGLADVQAVE